ncbi:MAG: hypothetical protein WCP30_15720, partial [Mycobacteriaceae bacterium]
MPEDVQPDRAAPQAVGAPATAKARGRAGVGGGGGRGRLFALLGVLIAVALGAWLLGPKLFGGPKPPSDFAGEGKEDIVI